MAKKIIAIILSMMVILCVIPFSVSADDEAVSSQVRVDSWNSNLYLVTEKLLDNESFPHWKYVAENNAELSKTMLTYTAFALYDDAWKNGFDKSVSIDRAEEILVSLIEKIDANIGESKLASIRKVLETAVSLEDLLQKVNGYVKISDILDSAEWSTAFRYIKWTIEGEKLYEAERERVIDAYAKILSVQAANDLYIDFLRYVAANSTYDVVATAANNLIASIEESIESLIKKEIWSATGFGASKIFDTATRIAMESNAYTAVALKVYNIGTSAADVLWNTSDQYELMDQLYTSFFVETVAADWVKAVNGAESYEFAIGALVTLRQVGAKALYDLKVAQTKGVVGKISNQINNTGFENVAELSFLNLAYKVLFEANVSEYVPVKSIVSINTNADSFLGGKAMKDSFYCGAEGYYSVDDNEFNNFTVTTVFASDANEEIKVTSSEKNEVTVIAEKLIGVGVDDYSFTNVVVGEGTELTFDSALNDGFFYNYTVGDTTSTVLFNEVFVRPYNEVSKEAIATAVVNIAKEEINSRVISLDQLLKGIFEKIKEILRSAFSLL